MKIFFSLVLSFSTAAANEQPLVRYDFTREACLGSQPISNLGRLGELPLFRNETLTACSHGLGVEVALTDGVSTSNAESLYGPDRLFEPLLNTLERRSPNNDGITISLWIKVLENLGDGMVSNIVSFGTRHKHPETATSLCDQKGIDFDISVLANNSLRILYRTSDPFYNPCFVPRALYHTPILPHKMYHVTVVLRDKHQEIFLNGQSVQVYNEPFDNSLKHWDRESTLFFFSNHYSTHSNGRLYQFSIHDELWDQTRIHNYMANEFPSSKPYIKAQDFRINEDADTSPGNHTLDWYTKPRRYSQPRANDTFSFPVITLPIGFVQQELDSLLDSLGISHLATPSVFVYITRFPSRGDLFQVNGTTPIRNDGNDTFISLTEPRLVFVPVHNEYSELPGLAYASFDYCASTERIFSVSQCESVETITILVDPVNDPPQAVFDNSTYAVHEGIHEEPYALKLFGIDVDKGDSISAIEITTTPRSGYLYLSVTSFRQDGLQHGTLLSDINFTLKGNPAFLEYRYEGSDQVVQGTAVTDSFQFRVRDNAGCWSAEETVQIKVLSGLTALPSTIVKVKEGESKMIRLYGKDTSGLNRTFGYFFDSIPSLTEGKLEDFMGLPVQKGSILLSEDITEGISVTFQPAVELCSKAPYATISFSYRIIAFDSNGRTSSASPVMEQVLQVECKADKLLMSTPQEKYTIHAFVAPMDDHCSGYMYNASKVGPESCPSAAIISGIKVANGETHIEPVHVSITANQGLLTLDNNNALPIPRMRSSIEFVTRVDKLDEALSGLHFQSDHVGADEIQIVIQYGECDKGETHKCYSTTLSIQIEVLSSPKVSGDTVYGDFPWFPLPFSLSMLLLLKLKGKAREKLGENEFDEEDDTGTSADTSNCRWIQYYDSDSGFYYYQNTEDGTVTWDPPLDEEFIPSKE